MNSKEHFPFLKIFSDVLHAKNHSLMESYKKIFIYNSILFWLRGKRICMGTKTQGREKYAWIKLPEKVKWKKANLARVWVRISSTIKGTMYLIEYANDQSKPMVLCVIQLQQIQKIDSWGRASHQGQIILILRQAVKLSQLPSRLALLFWLLPKHS